MTSNLYLYISTDEMNYSLEEFSRDFIALTAKTPDNLRYEVALCRALRTGKTKFCEILMSHDVVRDINIIHDDQTPLTLAIKKFDDKMVKLLIDKGANVNHANIMGQTPLHIAVLQNDIYIVKLLISKGAIVDIANKYGQTPLMLAIMKGYFCLIGLLIDCGANIYQLDKRGKLALNYANNETKQTMVNVAWSRSLEIKTNTLSVYSLTCLNCERNVSYLRQPHNNGLSNKYK